MPVRLVVVPAALAAGIGASAVMAGAPGDGPGVAEIAVALLVGWSFVASGLVALERRPENPTGAVMVATGFAWFAHELIWATAPLPWTLGQLLEPTYLLGAGYIAATFPEGRLRGSLERAIMATAVLLVGPLQVAWLLLGYGDARDCGACPDNLLQVADAPGASEAIVRVQQALTLPLAVAMIVLLVRRWRRASGGRRLALAPVLGTGAVAFALLVPWTLNDALGEPLGDWPDVAVHLGLAAVPVGFLVGLLRTRLARAAVAELMVELGSPLSPADLRAALARALRDPSLTVAYWLPEPGRYVDAEGRALELPAAGVYPVEREGRRIAALVHDPGLAEEPELVASVGAAAALALENSRLQAQLRARLEELRASRGRIVEAAQAERRRIERDLHDGTQQRLVALAMTLGLLDARLEQDPARARALLEQARSSLKDALAELRALAQGIHPGILTERGLAAALEELAYALPMPLELEVGAGLDARLPERAEAAAYYVVSEALSNVAKHARASAVRVRVDREDGRVVVEVADDGRGGAERGGGTGLRGLEDRVDALGGRLRVVSPPGKGTVLHAEIPCG